MEESRLQEALGNSARRPSIMPPTPGGVTFAAMHALVDVVRARSFSVRARLPGDDAHRQRHHLVVLDTERVAQLLCELLHRLRLACNSNSLCSVEEMCAAWEAIAPSRRANTPLQFVVGLAIEAGLLVQTSGGAYAAQTPMWLVAFAREIPAAEVLDKQRARYGAFDALACVTRIFRFDVGRELVLEAHANIAATMLVARGNLTIDVWRGGILYTTERRAEEPCAALVCMYVDGAGDLCVRIGARHRDVTHRVATHALSSVADALEEGMQMRHEATLCMCPAGEMRYMRERSANHRHHFDQAGIVERVMQGARNQALVCPACAEAVPVECVAPDLSPQYISRADARDTGGMVLIDELEPYVVGEPLGVGAFGTVVRAHVPGVVRDVAVKTLDRVSPREGSDAVRDLCSEMRLMAFVGKHENIVRLYGVVRSPPGMVLELADRGSLFEYIHERSSSSSRSSGDRESGRGSARLRRISMPAPRAPDFIECRLRLVLDVARGLAHTHARGILHRDLKSPNVLLFERRQAKSGERRRGVPDVVAKICDYGLGVSTSMTRQVREVRGDNPLWMAPEIMAGRAYSGASDVYGLGVIAYELVYERLPFADEHCKNAEVERRIMAGQRPLLDDNDGGGDANYNADANRIIEACWAHAPECRPSAARLCAMLEAAIDLRRRARRGGSRILANTLGEPRAAPPGAAL
jgi:serine/threonine protein kinase